jgi:hypothetical protein
VVMLRDDDAALGDEAAGSGPGGFHEGFPVAACGVGFVTWVAGDEFGGFRWTDGFGSVAVGFALGEELEDGGFEGGVLFSGAVAAAGRGTEFEDVPVAGVLFGPVEGALARLAEFFFVGGGAVGFGFSVGHCGREITQRGAGNESGTGNDFASVPGNTECCSQF